MFYFRHSLKNLPNPFPPVLIGYHLLMHIIYLRLLLLSAIYLNLAAMWFVFAMIERAMSSKFYDTKCQQHGYLS